MNLFDRLKHFNEVVTCLLASLIQFDSLLRSGINIEPATFSTFYARMADCLAELAALQQEITRLHQGQFERRKDISNG